MGRNPLHRPGEITAATSHHHQLRATRKGIRQNNRRRQCASTRARNESQCLESKRQQQQGIHWTRRPPLSILLFYQYRRTMR